MAFHFSLALLAAVLLNGAVLGDDSACSGALAGAEGKRNAPSRGGDAGRKGEGRARNGDKLVVLDSARTTPSETVRKSVSVVKRMSGQSSLSNRNEARNDHVGVGNELHDQPATSHKAQTSADDKQGMKLPRARRRAASRHSKGGLTSNSPKESAEALDRKKEFENMVSGIIAEEAEDPFKKYGYGGTGFNYDGYRNVNDYDPQGSNGKSDTGVQRDDSPSVQSNVSVSESSSSSTTGTTSSSGSDQNSGSVNEDKGNTNDGKEPKDEQKEEKEEKLGKKGDGKQKGEKQLERRSNENSNEQETNKSSDDTEKNEAPSSGNSAFLCGSYSSVLLVAVACLCACAC